MELSIYDEFEIKAHVFHAMTGHMAPGKDGGKDLKAALEDKDVPNTK